MTQFKSAADDASTLLGEIRAIKQYLQWETITGIASFVLKRLAFGILVLIAITYLSHLGLDMARGTAFHNALSPTLIKTLDSLARIVHGDFGLSPSASSNLNPLPISEVVPDMLAKSLGLLGGTLLLSTIVGVVMGVWAARHRYTNWSMATLIVSIIGVSIPSFFAALLLQIGVIILSRTLGHTILPVGGFGWDIHLVLPILVLAARPVAQITRITFITISDVLEQDYVRTAHSKGVEPHLVMSRHVLRNAAIPIITTIGLSLRFCLCSLPVVEYFFGWPGVGLYLLKAISQQDDGLTVFLLLCLGILFILVNLIIDILYLVLDPRLRTMNGKLNREEREPLLKKIKWLLSDLGDWIVHNPIARWLKQRKDPPSPNPFHAILEMEGYTSKEVLAEGQASRGRAWLRSMFSNVPLILGTILAVGIIIVGLFGDRLAPNSPYTTQGLTVVNGEYTVPPFRPSEVHPWGTDAMGRDIMSLVLAGAWQTLRLAAVVVLARIAVGFILGAITGWWSGSWIDRSLMGLAETISAFPTLILAMILILALGIRQGFAPFVIALCFVGWGEAMQYVRGEVIAIRPKAFIESAAAVGRRTPGIIVNHVLPNLVPVLISLAALEMGAVLMLLGELGFIGIFIGGGAFAELVIDAPPYHYSDVPEWGALLSNVRLYARSYPWTALYPALAFFIAILGFNLFGEGIRRLVTDMGVRINRLVNRYTVALGLIVFIGISWVRGSTGVMSIYSEQAKGFDGQRAIASVEALTEPELEGRALGTAGLDASAEWIAQQFEALGLQAAGEDMTYFQERSRSFERLESVPYLAIDDGAKLPIYRQDYIEFPDRYRNMGSALAPVRFLAMGNVTYSGTWGLYSPVLDEMDYSDEILMVLSGREVGLLEDVPRAGILVVAEDPNALQQNCTLSSREPTWSIFGTNRPQGQDAPTLWITEANANRLLKDTGKTVAELRLISEKLNQDDVIDIATGVVTEMVVQGKIEEKILVRHVIAQLPGVAGVRGHQLDDHLIVVLARYDNPPLGPEGKPYPGANDNASGVGVMLEAIRVMRESGYQPYKTFLFVAYSGEGLEGGNSVFRPEVSKLIQSKFGLSEFMKVEAIIELRGMGAGEGDSLMLLSGGSMRLADLFKEAARRTGVKANRAGEELNVSVIYGTGSSRESGEEAPRIGLSWEGWEETSRTTADTLESVSAEKLEKAGRALSLGLMILGRETQY